MMSIQDLPLARIAEVPDPGPYWKRGIVEHTFLAWGLSALFFFLGVAILTTPETRSLLSICGGMLAALAGVVLAIHTVDQSPGR